MHLLFDESNSLVENDAQDKHFELGLAKKDLLPTHVEGKDSQDGSGTEPVSKEEGQGDKQTGGTAADPVWSRTRMIVQKQDLEQSHKQALVQAQKQGPEHLQSCIS